jgi:hypothetical protein
MNQKLHQCTDKFENLFGDMSKLQRRSQSNHAFAKRDCHQTLTCDHLSSSLMKKHRAKMTDLKNCGIAISQFQNCSGAGECKDLGFLVLSSLMHDVQNQSIQNALCSRDTSQCKLFGNAHFPSQSRPPEDRRFYFGYDTQFGLFVVEALMDFSKTAIPLQMTISLLTTPLNC